MSRPPENPPIGFHRPHGPSEPPRPAPPYAELQCVTNFSFLRGASHPGELVIQAKSLGHSAIGIADRNSLAGIVRAHGVAKEEGIRLVVGARLDTLPLGYVPATLRSGVGVRMADTSFAHTPPGFSVIAYPTDRAAYGRLSQLISAGRLKAPKGECHLTVTQIARAGEGMLFIAIPPRDYGSESAAQETHATTRSSEPTADWWLDSFDAQSWGTIDREREAHAVAAFHARASRQVANDATITPYDVPLAPPPTHPASRMRAFTRRDVPVPLPANDVRQNTSRDSHFEESLDTLIQFAPGRVWIAAHRLHTGEDRSRIMRLLTLSQRTGAPLVATNDVVQHHPDRRALADTLACIRTHSTVEQAGFHLAPNAERYLKPPREMSRLFTEWPDAIAQTQEIVSRIDFNLDQLRYNYPTEPVPDDVDAQTHLERLTWKSARTYYPDGVPDAVQANIAKEFELIARLDYAPYFLTVHDIVRYARSEGILCQGRGSAANSAVCYCLGITAVDPSKSNLLFERFLSEERKEPPDIDVDFEHERREEVIQYIYRRYGRTRAALAATVITYRPRSAVREVGKAMGLSEDVTSMLASTVWGSWGRDLPEDQVREVGIDVTEPRIAATIALTKQLLGFPRHLSQHVGGFVLTNDAVTSMVPVLNAAMPDRTFIEWDKDDIDELGIMKIDVLALGMLSCVAKCLAMVRTHYRQDYHLANLPHEDAATYEMLQRGDSLGTFQVESRAQMAMLPRLKPKEFYDLVIQVAIVRPGPIQGDMVHPYLRRRDKLEDVVYPRPAPEHGDPMELENILGRTLGVPLFQEQAMQIALDAAQFSPEEANQLRRAMATFRKTGTIHTLQDKMVLRMIERGYDADFAHRCFEQIRGFGEYGFPESHAASFAHIVYVSCWLKCHFPDVFCAGLLNSQPMGFYAPAQIVRDAREHGVDVRPIDINHSRWDCTLEETDTGGHAVRLGFRQVDGLREETMNTFVANRTRRFATIEESRRIGGLTVATLERLASADAMRSMGLDRRAALWDVRGLMSDTQLPLFAGQDATGPDQSVALPDMRPSEHVVADYQTHRLSLKAHPLTFLRPRYDIRRIRRSIDLEQCRQDQFVQIAGVVLVRQKPGTAKGVVFITIEDETGVANIVVWSKLVTRYRRTVMGARMLLVSGRVQRKDSVIHVVASQLHDLTADLDLLSDDPFRQPLDPADHVKAPLPESSSSDRKRLRLEQAGRGLERSIAESLTPLTQADEVLHPQEDRAGPSRDHTGVPLHAENPAKPNVDYDDLPLHERPHDGPGYSPDKGSSMKWKHPRDVRVIPKSRDFH